MAGVDCNHEKEEFEVDAVALHIHERISARAQKSQRESVQRDLFATSDGEPGPT